MRSYSFLVAASVLALGLASHPAMAQPRPLRPGSSTRSNAAVDVANRHRYVADVHGPTSQAANLVTAPRFIRNQGQYDPRVLFHVALGADNVWFLKEGVVFDTAAAGTVQMPLQVRPQVPSDSPKVPTTNVVGVMSQDRKPVTLRFVNSSTRTVDAEEELATTYNFISKPSRTVANVKSFNKIIYRDVWPGIDVTYFLRNGHLEQEILLSSGAALDKIRITYEGADSITVNSSGALDVTTPNGWIAESAPVVFETVDGRRHEIAGHFVVHGEHGTRSTSHRILLLDP